MKILFAGLIFAVFAIMILGFYTLMITPYIGMELVLKNNIEIVKIEDMLLEKSDFQRFPEFFSQKAEAFWWQRQEKLYNIIRQKKIIRLELPQYNSPPIIISVQVKSFPTIEIFKKVGLIDLIALIFVILALHLFYRTNHFPNQLCAFFMAFLAMYYTSAAPVIYRDITLPPFLFQFFIKALFIGAGGLITLIHFSLIFPKPKSFLIIFPKLIYVLYAYFLTSVLLYFLKITAFGATFPFLFFWVIIMAGAFLHSWISEKELFLKKQIHLTLMSPIIVGLVFILLFLLPPFLNLPPMDFTYFALFSLVLPFSLSFATENFYLYQENINKEIARQKEREHILEELHDNLGNDLINIKVSSEAAIQYIPHDLKKVEETINNIQNLSKNCLEQLRNFLWVIDLEANNWEEIIGYFKETGEKVLENNNIKLEWIYLSPDKDIISPSFALKFNLSRIYKEIITNILKHANAKKVKINFLVNGSRLEMKIEDDGVGFDINRALQKSTYGLKNMSKRIKEIGGKIEFISQKGKGCVILLIVPFVV